MIAGGKQYKKIQNASFDVSATMQCLANVVQCALQLCKSIVHAFKTYLADTIDPRKKCQVATEPNPTVPSLPGPLLSTYHNINDYVGFIGDFFPEDEYSDHIHSDTYLVIFALRLVWIKLQENTNILTTQVEHYKRERRCTLKTNKSHNSHNARKICEQDEWVQVTHQKQRAYNNHAHNDVVPTLVAAILRFLRSRTS